jgi:hypothetical protein
MQITINAHVTLEDIYELLLPFVKKMPARKVLGGKETPILASSWGQQLPPFYRKVFKDDILLFAFPREAPTWKTIEAPEVPVGK